MNETTFFQTQVWHFDGSDSDWPTMESAADVAKNLNRERGAGDLGASRSRGLEEYISGARERGCGSSSRRGRRGAFAGCERGVNDVARHRPCRFKARPSTWMDFLLSIVADAAGVPVATVGINAGEECGILAVQILSTADPKLQKHGGFQVKLMEESRAENATLQK